MHLSKQTKYFVLLSMYAIGLETVKLFEDLIDLQKLIRPEPRS